MKRTKKNKRRPLPRVQALDGPMQQAPGKRMEEQRIVLRWKVLLVTLVAVIVAVPLASAWHSRQIYLQADAYLKRAKSLEQSTDWDGAAQVYHRYLQLRPDDSQARLLLAGALDQAGEEFSAKYRALDYYRFVLGLLPQDIRVHERVAQLSLELGKYVDAEQYARSLLQSSPGNPTGLRVVALAVHASSRFDEKIPFPKLDEAYLAAEKANPAATELFISHARLCRDNQSPSDSAARIEKADDVMNRLIKLNPDSTAAWLARHAYRVRYGLAKADDDLNEAFEIDEQNLEVLIAMAERAFRRSQFDDAVRYFERASAAVPADRRPYLRISDIELARGDSNAAKTILEKGLKAVSDNDLALCAQLTALLIERREVTVAETMLFRMQGVTRRIESRLPRPDRLQLQCGLEWIRANLLIEQGKFMPAARLLQSVLSMRDDNAGFSIATTAEADIFSARGRCYMALGEWDQAVDDFTRAANKNPKTSRHSLAAAEAFEAAGRFDEAIQMYKRAAAIPDAPPAVTTSLAAAHFRLEMSRPANQRDWLEFQQALNTAQKSPNLSLRLLEIEFFDAQGRRDDALALLKSLEKDHSDDERLWSAAARFYQRAGRATEAAAAITKLSGEGKPSDEAVLLQADMLCRGGSYDEAIRLIQKHLPIAVPNNRLSLEVAQAEIAIRSGRQDDARATFMRLAMQPDADVRLVAKAGDLALAAGLNVDAEQIEKRLQDLEGKDGCQWRDLRIRRLLAGVSSPDDPLIPQLERLQQEIVERRPQWARGYVLAGLLGRVRGNEEAAIQGYTRAVELGETQLDVLKQLATLLFHANRITDAEKILKQTGGSVSDGLELGAAAVFAHYRQGDLRRAIELAQEAAKGQGDDVLPQIWLGQLLLLDDRGEEAEAQFQKAVRQAPGDWRCRLSLISAQVRLGRKSEAEKTIVEMEQSSHTDAAQKSFGLAQAYAIVGDLEKARSNFTDARDAAPNDLNIRQAYATFLAATDPFGAERELRDILSVSPTSGATRRALASILAARGGEAAWQEAWSLVDESKTRYVPTDADRRLQAVLLSRHGTEEKRRKAIGILEELLKQTRNPSSGDRLLLAKLHDESDHAPQARKHLESLVASGNVEPIHTAIFADFLLRHRDFAAAEVQIAHLEKEPENEFLSMPLRVRCLHAQGKDDEVPPRADGFLSRYMSSARSVDEKANGLMHVASLYSEVGMTDRAERLYRQAGTMAPSGFRPLARHLALSGKPDEAVAICLVAVEADADAETVKVLCAALARAPAADPRPNERAEKVLTVATQKHTNNPDVLTAVATLRYLQQRNDEAIQLFEKVLTIAPDNWQACNNLANLLSESPGRRRDAVKYAEKAIELQGHRADLLDTLGVALLRSGNVSKAIETLHEAAYSPQKDSRYHFHLALAYQQSGATQEARLELEKSRKQKLSDAALPPFDRVALADLEKALSGK